MVPVLDLKKVPLMPCLERRARELMEKGDAKPYWKNGVFCIILQREPSARNYQEVVIGIDTGSKRTGITTATEKRVISNQLFNTPGWVKKKVKNRKDLRRSRRYRKTPYRKCRSKRKIGGIPPSTKARWGAHLRVIDFWKKLIPLTIVSLEDIKAKSKKNCRKWNKNFSPLEVGKKWFEDEIKTRGYKFYKFEGFKTKEQRDYREFNKSKNKLKESWDSHNVDSHCLCELALGDIKPYYNIQVCEFFQWHRRQLHASNPQKEGKRRIFGMTRSLGFNRGTLVKHNKYGLTYIGGNSKGKISLHNIETGDRITQEAHIEDCKILSISRWIFRNGVANSSNG
jgi:hypothetical protein